MQRDIGWAIMSVISAAVAAAAVIGVVVMPDVWARFALIMMTVACVAIALKYWRMSEAHQ